MALVPADKSKDTLRNYEELLTKIRDLTRSKTNNSDDYDEKYMKIKFNSDDDLLIQKTLELHSVVIVFRADFHEDKKNYPQIFLHECLYKL